MPHSDCHRKQSYERFSQAIRAIKNWRRHGNLERRQGQRTAPYHCRGCHGIHLGNEPVMVEVPDNSPVEDEMLMVIEAELPQVNLTGLIIHHSCKRRDVRKYFS